MSSKWFRYGFLIFFLTMFGNMVFQTYLVGAGASPPCVKPSNYFGPSVFHGDGHTLQEQ